MKCPACGKTDADRDGSGCRRCGCELNQLQAITQRAIRHLAGAKRYLQQEDWLQALHHAESSWTLVHSSLAARLAFLASTALHNDLQMIRWYHLGGE